MIKYALILFVVVCFGVGCATLMKKGKKSDPWKLFPSESLVLLHENSVTFDSVEMTLDSIIALHKKDTGILSEQSSYFQRIALLRNRQGALIDSLEPLQTKGILTPYQYQAAMDTFKSWVHSRLVPRFLEVKRLQQQAGKGK